MPDNLALFCKALDFAAHKHTRQRRKDAESSPYINHPIALAHVLTNEGNIDDINVLCAAILHDTIEDTHTSFIELVENFGEPIALIVNEVTDDKSLPKAERKRLQIEHAPHLSYEAKLIKLADKIANLRDIALAPPAYWDPKRVEDYYAWAGKVIDGLRGAHEGLEAIFDELMSTR